MRGSKAGGEDDVSYDSKYLTVLDIEGMDG